MKVYSLVLVLACVGCDESKVTNPTLVGPIPVIEVDKAGNPVCYPFELEWPRDVNLASPSVTFYFQAAIEAVTIEEYPFQVDGSKWAFWPALNGRIGQAWEVRDFFAHDQRYRIKARLSGCWSTWHEFRVGPKNPDASGQTATRAPVEWTQCQGSDPKTGIVGVGFVVNWTNEPYLLTVTTKDENHRPGYQVGQVETLKVETDGWVGFTDDIPDDRTEVKTSWWNTHTGPIRLTKSQGSVHGVCVTVRQ